MDTLFIDCKSSVGGVLIIIEGLNVLMLCGKVFKRSWSLSSGAVSGDDRDMNGGSAHSKLIAGLFEIGDDESAIKA